jgi:hypothetical protein
MLMPYQHRSLKQPLKEKWVVPMVLGAIIITGDLDLDADITSATSLSVSADTNLAADVTTSVVHRPMVMMQQVMPQ